VNNLDLFGIGYSWGGFESLAIYQDISKSRNFYKFATDEHLVRIHVGLEDPQDLINDLKRSLKYIK
jgi:cystathionine beta-lyase